jgi:uncharacterized protein with GYD domain
VKTRLNSGATLIWHQNQNSFWWKNMPLFVVLGKWTDQGIRNIKDASERGKKAKSMLEKAGGNMHTYYTLGEYDFVGIVEVPTDEDIMKILLCLGSMGNIRTKTMKAWKESEFNKALSEGHSFEKYVEKQNTPL